MYANILSGILAANGIEDTDLSSQINYLDSLKPSARRLWQAYQNQAVAVSYSDHKVQEAYLLRYFVPYSHLISVLLKRLELQGTIVSRNDGLLSACFFGCGPGPELAGLVRHLNQSDDRPEMLLAQMFDAASDSWKHGRALSQSCFLANEWDPALIEAAAFSADISATDLLINEAVRNSVVDADLIVFQNCLNELSQTQLVAASKNLRAFILAAKDTAVFLVIERDGYDSTRDMLLDLQQWAETLPGLSVSGELTSKVVLNCRPLLNRIPTLITEHLFVRKRDMSPIQNSEYGLILAADIKYKWLAISKASKKAAKKFI